MEFGRTTLLRAGAVAALLTFGACTMQSSGPAPAPTMTGGQITVHWLGQAAMHITSPTGKVIVIDPFITQNPKTPADQKDLAKLGKVDVILVTHGHGDHIGDVSALQKQTGATV